LTELGLPASTGRTKVRAGRWQPIVPGIFATFTGPVPVPARIWALVLHCGPGAVVGGEAALYLAGLRERPPERVVVCVPHGRRPVPRAGLQVRERRGLAQMTHPGSSLPRLRVEEAVLDVADEQNCADGVVDILSAVVQRRLTTSERLTATLRRRPRHRWRALVWDVLGDTASGAHSVLERRYLVDVERAHGLPVGERNRPEPLSPDRRAGLGRPDGAGRLDGAGRVRYRDVRYRQWSVVAELDGWWTHPPEAAFRDRARDNAAVRGGEVPLRYGWREVAGNPCGVAREVAAVLRDRGWTGAVRPCGPHCTAMDS
jgi:hypothetical protein